MLRHAILSLLIASLMTVACASFCNNTSNETLKHRYISRRGRTLNVTLHWATDPARAASALFAAILKKALGYQSVYLRQSPYLDLRTFAAKVPHNKTRRYDEVILALSMAWEPGHNPEWAPNVGAVCGLAGPRLEEFGASSVPVRQRLHVYIAEHFRNRSQCLNVTQWSFYTNDEALQQCGFTNIISSDENRTNVVVYELDSMNTTMTKLKEFADLLHFKIKNTNRTKLFGMLQTGNHSFLFVDYDIWSDHSYVRPILQPFCLPSAVSTCLLEQSSAVAMRVGDVSMLTEYGPELLQVANNFTTSTKAIREILELEGKQKNIEKAAYEWVTKNNASLEWTINEYKASRKVYQIISFYCKDDPYLYEYDELIESMCNGSIHDFDKSLFTISVTGYPIDCSDVNQVKNILNDFLALGIKQRLIGVIVGSMNNITHVAKTVEASNVPVLYYDAVGLDMVSNQLGVSTWLTTGRSRHLALALRRFILSMGWIRVAVLSEMTETAKRFVDDLNINTNKTIFFGNHYIRLNLTKLDAKSELRKIKNESAHIIIVNTNYKDAATILAAGAELGMSSTKEYAWIVRDWRPNKKTANIRHFTFSFWCRCGSHPSNADGIPEIRKKIDKLYPNCTWPPHAATIADTVLTLVNGFKSAILKCPQIRNDLRNNEAIQLFERIISDKPIQGITQNLTYKGHSLEETVVFVDEWHGDQHNHLARWRVNAETGQVLIEHKQRAAYPSQSDQPHDGSWACLVTSGDPYLPTCHDWELIIAIILIFLSLPTLILVYRYLRHRLKKHEREIIYKVLAERRQRAAALSAGYLVDRSALTLRHELGSGRFGFVRLANLRLPGRASQFVAAKSLREHQDESEILHEACVLASLHHENIIRLIGVCVDKDPPLVLMEVAFFGDLLQYLRDRRYLVEGVSSELMQSDRGDEEVTHVSAEALTRLARQAAAALGYLSLRGVIHRDLRASNCLVDANRNLKLADFGLARETKATGLDGGSEYACRRRGLFPVLWMAPESLLHGVFSAASDVWAFGVLIFELVTLGARPFGDMSPLRVMQYVVGGGKLSMPRDATPQTIALTRLCWQREAEQRPTAANLGAYLADQPNALRPALDSNNEQPTDGDSGCGESPISEFLLG